MERRIVAQLLTSMDELTLEKTGGCPVVVLGATNRPGSCLLVSPADPAEASGGQNSGIGLGPRR